MKRKRFIYAKKFHGFPKPSDFQLVEEEIPAIKKKGEVLFEALFLSVDPYMRSFADDLQVGQTMYGAQVARVVESRHQDFKVGDNVVGYFGWQTHTVVNPDEVVTPFGEKPKPYVVPDFGDGVSLSHALGALGMPGVAAYFGLTEVCEPKPGEVLVVTAAAGAVGSLVGQIGKILGLKVIGFAGSDEKVKLLKEEFGFDAAFNYKTKNVCEALKEAAPNGVDCYFDNVGGKISSDVIECMNKFGRVSCCGSISEYNDIDDSDERHAASAKKTAIRSKKLKVEGFGTSRWKDVWFDGIKQNLEYMKAGKLKCKETIYEGFEKMPEAFIGLFKGENVGKAIVKV